MTAIPYDKDTASELIASHGARPELLVQILHSFLECFAWIPEAAIRQLAEVKSVRQAQRFLSVHGVIRNLSNLGRHQLSSANYRLLRERSFKEWSAATTA